MAACHQPGRTGAERAGLLVTPGRIVRLVAAAALAAATGAALPASPASAATCSSATGVSVVVDFSQVGGGIESTCVEGGGGDKASALLEVSHDLTRDAQYQGVVCKIDEAPADAECQTMPPADAYWGLFWSDGSGGWTYSSQGVDNLEVPAGGSVGMAWQDGGSNDPPGTAPPQHSTSTPSPSPSPTGGKQSGGSQGGSQSGSQAGSPSGSPTGTSTSTSPSAAASGTPTTSGAKRAHHRRERKHGRHAGEHRHHQHSGPATPSGSDSASPTDEPSSVRPVADPSSASSDHLPWWVMPVLLVAIFGTAGAIALERRRRRP